MPPNSRVRGVLLVIALVLVAFAIAFGIVYGIGQAAGGLSWQIAIFWAFVAASWWIFPNRHLLVNEIAILGLFALSLDLILGYAGLISLGHAAFQAVGAYVAAGVFALVWSNAIVSTRTPYPPGWW